MVLPGKRTLLIGVSRRARSPSLRMLAFLLRDGKLRRSRLWSGPDRNRLIRALVNAVLLLGAFPDRL